MKSIQLMACAVTMAFAVGCNQKTNDDGYANGNDNTEFGTDGDGVASVEDNREENAAFVSDLIASNHAEIAMAQLALEKSNSNEVKELAQMLQQDHTKALQELQALAGQKGYSVPSGPKEDAQEKMSSLREETDVKKFNEKWSEQMVRDHKKTIDKLEDQRDDTQDTDLQAWIDKTLPTLKTHLEHSQRVEENTKKNS